MTVLELSTALVFTVAIHLLLAVLLGLFWRSAGRGSGFGTWVLAEILLALGVVVMMAAPLLPPLLATSLSNACYLVFLPMLELGLRRWFGLPLQPAMRVHVLLAVFGFGAWLTVYLGGADYASRAALISAVNAIQAALLLIPLWRLRSDGAQLGLQVMRASVVFGLLCVLVRVVAMVQAIGQPMVAAGSVLALTLLASLIAAVTRVSAMLLFLHQRAERDLRAATTALEQRANVDALTAVATRAHFEARAAELLALAAEQRVPVCLMVCDLDAFKAVNDELGHPEGDAVLVRFAALLRAATRKGDLAGRLGGDEFVLLFMNCPAERALEAADRLRERMAALQASDGRRLTLSAGLLAVPRGQDLATAYERADRALYAAKQGGRNRIVLA